MDLTNCMFDYIPNTSFRYVILEVAEREKLYQYLGDAYPNLCKISLRSEKYLNEINRYLRKCPNCDNIRIRLESQDVLHPNSSDEYYINYAYNCKKCGNSGTQECQEIKHKNTIYVEEDNIIAFGEYFKKFIPPTRIVKMDVTKEEIFNILKNKTIYEVRNPSRKISKIKLVEYIENYQ